MNRHSLQRIILEELSSSRKVKKLKLSEALGDAGHSLLMKLDDGIFVHDNSLMFEQLSADPSIGGGPTGYEEVDAPQPAKYPASSAADEPDPEDDLVKAARDAELASKAREEEVEARASASAGGAPAGSTPAPPTPARAGSKSPSSLISIFTQGAEEERKNKKRGNKPTPETRPTSSPTTSAEPAGVKDPPDKDRESTGIEDSGPRTDTPSRSDEKETYEEDGEKVTVDLRAALDYIERFARSRSRVSESRNKKTKF